MDDTAVLDPQKSGGDATDNQDPGHSPGTEPVASESPQGQENNAGASQEGSEGGRAEGTETRRPAFRSKNQTIYELRQKLRERDSYWQTEVGTLKEQIAQIQKLFGRGQNPKPSRTFWEAPEEVLEERLQNHMTAMEERLAERWEKTQTASQENSEWKQETSEAAKFIRGQKGLSEDDLLELSNTIREHPLMEKLRPMERAEYALFLFNRDKGVSDKTVLKGRAASVNGSGQNPAAEHVWTEQEMEAEYRKLGDPKNWTAETHQKAKQLEQEFMRAYSEKRVKK